LSKAPSNNESPQDTYLRISVALKNLEEQVPMVQDQLNLIYNNIESYEMARQTIESLKDLDKDAEIMVPIANLIIMKVKVQDPNKYLVNIGNDISLVKNAEDTIKYIDKNIDLLNNMRQQLERDFQELMTQIQALQQKRNELLKMISGQSGGQIPGG